VKLLEDNHEAFGDGAFSDSAGDISPKGSQNKAWVGFQPLSAAPSGVLGIAFA
jgi:hypothetical protein